MSCIVSCSIGVANEPGHQKAFALTGNIVGSQMPQTTQIPVCALDLLPRPIKVAKLADQLASLQNPDVHNLGPVAIGTDATLYDEVKT